MTPIIPPGTDDRGRLRWMVGMAIAAGPLAFLLNGISLFLHRATLHADGKTLDTLATSFGGNDMAVYALFFVFLSAVAGCRSGRAFFRITVAFLVGLSLAVGALALLLRTVGFPLLRAEIEMETAATVAPLVVLFAYWLFRRWPRTNPDLTETAGHG